MAFLRQCLLAARGDSVPPLLSARQAAVASRTFGDGEVRVSVRSLPTARRQVRSERPVGRDTHVGN